MSNVDMRLPRHVVFYTSVAQSFAWVVAKTVATLFLSVKVEGKENLQGLHGGAIFASNHASDLDSILIRTSLPLFSKLAPLFAVGRSSNTYEWSGWRKFIYTDIFFKLLGAHEAPKGTRSYEKALKTFVELGNLNQSILIFIGGRQLSEDEPIKNRGGTSYLSSATGLPVVPVSITGTYGMTRIKFLCCRRKIVVRFGVPKTKEQLFVNTTLNVDGFHNVSASIVRDIEDMRNNSASKSEN